MDIEEVFLTTMIGFLVTIIVSFLGYLAYVFIREVGLWSLIVPAILVVSFFVGRGIIKTLRWMEER